MDPTAKPPALWYPPATRVIPQLPTKGRYTSGYPRGAVVHYTAGAYGLSELDLARQLGYAYFLIDEHGGVHQGFPLDRWGSHAGLSQWPGIGTGVSRELVGIEVDCGGILKRHPTLPAVWTTWWGKAIPPAERREVAAEANRVAGVYHHYTPAQEASLAALLVWLKGNNPEVFDLNLVLGHDEVSPGRKQDPGGALSLTMPAFRELLQKRYREAASGAPAA